MFKKNVDELGKAQKNGSRSGGREVKYQMMQDPYFDSLSFSQKAALLGINRRSYYKWLQQPPPDPNTIQKKMRLRD